MIRYEQQREFLLWAAQQLDAHFDSRLCTWLSHWNDDELLAVVVYSNYTGCNVEMSIASWSPRWGTRGFIRECFRYPFDRLGCDRVTITVKSTNLRMLDLAKRLGFQQEGVHPKFVKGCDAISFGMLKDSCKWLDSTSSPSAS